MQNYVNSAAYDNGYVIAGASVSVYLTGTATLATLYSSNSLSGGTKTNPLTTDSNGSYSFYAPNGLYDISVTSPQGVTITLPAQSLNDPTNVLTYDTGVNMLRLLRSVPAIGVGASVNSLGDGYTTQAGINEAASTNWMYDSRYAFEPSRSGGQTVFSSTTSSYTGWTADNSGTGTNTLYADPNNPYTPSQNAFDFATGVTIGSLAGAKYTNIGSVPATFGLFFQTDLVATSNNLNDALLITLGNVNTANLELSLNSAGFYVFLSGSWQSLFHNGGGSYYTEWWLNCVFNTGTNYTLTLYAGTQLVGTLTGNLPGSGINGQLIIQQQSGTTANMHARVAGFNVGTTQLADNMTLISNGATALISPATVKTVVLVEDTSVSLLANSNFFLDVSQNNGSTWETTTLTNLGTYGLGVVDNTKPVYMLGNQHVYTNIGANSPSYRIRSTGNQWYAVLGAYQEWI